ncbi:phosphoglycerate kinase [Candidatus Heimdallarchaeota archaeon B3_Heim]|nr:MAG: phosphoglycerate kinase [Candidatus Heimdallarchaeota archaeon B3_Heim]
MRTLLDFALNDKVCLTRVDFNCPLNDDKKILDYTRIKAHAETVKAISDNLGKSVIIAHQGRPGSSDFTSLAQHSEKLQLVLSEKYKVDFIGQTHGVEVEQRISQMNSGNILVLENVRQVEGETKNKTSQEHANNVYIKSLAKVGDIFINDAFSATHRSHMSLVGFTGILPSAAGLIMEREVSNLQRVVDNPQKPCVFILGGVKPEDSFKVADYVLRNDIADAVLTGGVISEILLIAMGKSLGIPSMDFLKKKNLLQFVDPAKKLLSEFTDKIEIQQDFAVDENGRTNYTMKDLPLKASILDIGEKTIQLYTEIIQNSSTCVFNGPMGKFEDPEFAKGTLEVFKAMSKSQGFSLAGGGHSISILEKNKLKLSYMSTAGGAMIRFLMGKTLPAIDALYTNAQQFSVED